METESSFENLTARLDQISDRLDRLSALINEQSANGWCAPKTAANILDIKNEQGIYSYIAQGVFRPGSELLCIGPRDAKRPTYRINVRAYYERLAKEQALVS
jgi:hypothetical protein